MTLLISGFTKESFVFLNNHPEVLVDASILSAAAVLAQWFIYSLVQDFGALVFAATMNVRQVASILASYIYFHHTISIGQVISLIIGAAFLFSKSCSNLLCDLREMKPLVRHQQDMDDLKKNTRISLPSPP